MCFAVPVYGFCVLHKEQNYVTCVLRLIICFCFVPVLKQMLQGYRELPLHKDVLSCAQGVETRQDPVAGKLHIVH